MRWTTGVKNKLEIKLLLKKSATYSEREKPEFDHPRASPQQVTNERTALSNSFIQTPNEGISSERMLFILSAEFHTHEGPSSYQHNALLSFVTHEHWLNVQSTTWCTPHKQNRSKWTENTSLPMQHNRSHGKEPAATEKAAKQVSSGKNSLWRFVFMTKLQMRSNLLPCRKRKETIQILLLPLQDAQGTGAG